MKLRSGMNGIAEKTFETWQRGLDPGKRWMKVAIVDGHVVHVWCALCTKHGKINVKVAFNIAIIIIHTIIFFWRSTMVKVQC